MRIRLIKLLFFLAILGVIGLSGYAYLGDMSPPSEPQSTTVILNEG